MIPIRLIDEVLGIWGIRPGRIRPDIEIAGSPDRCLFRTVVEDEDGRLYVLEKLPAATAAHQAGVARILAHLSERGLSRIFPYLPYKENAYLAERENVLWRIAPYIEGVPISRPEFAFQGWRGPLMADFLIDLWTLSEHLPSFEGSAPLSITAFLRKFTAEVARREPGLYERIRPARDFLEREFSAAHDRLPVRLCHGDFHPLNMIWSDSGIRAVIDWEFLGWKPEIYDAAMMIGCLGMEDPQSLTGDLVLEFVGRLKRSGLISEAGWTHFMEFVLALRFAWLSNWLRRADSEMVVLEAVYIGLLLENRDVFARIFSRA